MVHDGGAYLVTLYMINCNVIISMLHYHVPYMKDLPKNILSADQKERGLWELDWRQSLELVGAFFFFL